MDTSQISKELLLRSLLRNFKTLDLKSSSDYQKTSTEKGLTFEKVYNKIENISGYDIKFDQVFDSIINETHMAKEEKSVSKHC